MAHAHSPAMVAKPPIELLTAPFRRFARVEASGGVLLLLCTIVALVWANSPLAQTYHAIWERSFTVGAGFISITESYHGWINDALMSIFFFLMGLEIKREILAGELSSLRSAAFPFVAAVGGSCLPVALYILLARDGALQRGWAIPMATDIAFALGVLAVLGRHVPPALKIFVTALAIVDDVFAVLVIAFFYTAHISYLYLGLTLVGLSAACAANWLGIRKPSIYAAVAVFVWLAVLNSGVHATIAGVLMALTIPASTWADTPRFVRSSRLLLNEIEKNSEPSAQHDHLRALQSLSETMQSPLHRIEHGIQPWVSFLIMPLFALANAGVHIGNAARAFLHPVMLGSAIGLLIGKPLGITSFAWLAAKLKVAAPPAGVRWSQIFAASWLCGIGFTMSLFIAGLAFGHGDLLDAAKVGIFSGSVLAGIAGAIVFKNTAGGNVSEEKR